MLKLNTSEMTVNRTWHGKFNSFYSIQHSKHYKTIWSGKSQHL